MNYRNIHDSYPKISDSVIKQITKTLNIEKTKKLYFNIKEISKYINNRVYFEHPIVINNSKLDKNDKKRWADDFNPDINELENRITYYNGYPIPLKDISWTMNMKDNLHIEKMLFNSSSTSYENLESKEIKHIKRPQNPVQYTGYSGRGLLGKWGPNYAADPIVYTYDGKSIFGIKFIAIKRGDCGKWAIPGGMVEFGDNVSTTLRKEFEEETQNLPDDEKSKFKSILDRIFKNGHLIYKGYIDDPRNTDNAWIETNVYAFFIPIDVANKLKFNAGDDAVNVDWVEVSNNDNRYLNLYAEHKKFINILYYRNSRYICYTFIVIYITTFTILCMLTYFGMYIFDMLSIIFPVNDKITTSCNMII